jgi:phage recombination protein Bet
MTDTPMHGKLKFTEEQKVLLVKSILKEKDGKQISTEEVERFVYVCERTGLDPFLNQIYPNWRWNSDLSRNEIVGYQTGIDGLRLTAERSGKYRGQTKPEWCGSDGKWVDVWIPSEPPVAARIGVMKEGFSEPTYAVAKWDSYVPKMKSQKTGEFFIGPMWKKMPDNQLVKCAEAAALRKAFPQETMGLYVKEEMEQATADNENEEKVSKPKEQSKETRAPESVGEPQKKVKKEVTTEEKAMANTELTNQFNAFMTRMNKEGISSQDVLTTMKNAKPPMIQASVNDLSEVPPIVLKKMFQPAWTEALIEKHKNQGKTQDEPAPNNPPAEPANA